MKSSQNKKSQKSSSKNVEFLESGLSEQTRCLLDVDENEIVSKKEEFREFATKILISEHKIYLLNEKHIIQKMEDMIDLLDVVL